MRTSSIWTPFALLPHGWARDVRIDIGADGTIERVTPHSPREGAALVGGPLVPGMPNVHSHAFQRAFAGDAERRASDEDDFWSWRSRMYGVAARLHPDDLEAIATQLYLELLEAGYTSVGEFHYLHHAPDGAPYTVRSEMAQRLLAAADATGIGITLLPVFYRWSGFGRREPLPEQRRFVTDPDAFSGLVDELTPLCATPQRRLGIAPHSLRAVAPDELQALVRWQTARDPDGPIHLHLAEQTAEVEASIAALGMRPARWLAEHVALDARWCLVHATHLDAAEVELLATSGAIAGLCPTTEANLGDGFFPLRAWLDAGGRFGIGSDSQVTTDPAAELRWLEYGQRLRARRRAVGPAPGEAYAAAAHAGGLALGRGSGSVAAGARADFVVLDAQAPSIADDDPAVVLDRYVTCGARDAVGAVYAGGREVVRDGRHPLRDAAGSRFRAARAKALGHGE